MDKLTSVLAALDAGKAPSTEQFCAFIDWVDKTVLPSVEREVTTHLTPQGALLAKRIRQVLYAHKQLSVNKNGDNILQEALWHLTHSEIETTGIDTEAVSEDLTTLRSAVRSLMSIAWSSISSESGSLLNEFASFTRLSLADAAELLEATAGSAKESLREIEQGVQKGQRTAVTGREKQQVEAEQKDVKVKWEHGVDTVKVAGDTVIDTTRSISATVQDQAEKTKNRARDAYLKVRWPISLFALSDYPQICDRAQSDPAYRQAIEGLISVLEKRTHQALEASSADTLASLFEDTSPEKHLQQALNNLQTLFERLSSYPLSRLIAKIRGCLDQISRDPLLRGWFDDFFALARKNLTEPGFVHTDESKKQRHEMRERWKVLTEREDAKWQKAVDGVKVEITKIQDGLNKDKDLQRLRLAHRQLAEDLEKGLIEASEKAETGLEALVERATWFWQDLFKVYIPHLLSCLTHLPIPR